MYTSGCPKNQNRCWYRIGSPPPLGSKNVVLKFRSVSSMVIAPASTGKARSSNIVVIRILQANSGMCSEFMPCGRILMIVTMKLSDLRMDDAPAKWSLRMARSTDGPEWDAMPERGG